MIYFTSDLNLGEAHSIKFFNRPFWSLSEMDKIILDNFKRVITLDDELFILGNLSDNPNKAQEFFNLIKCKKMYYIFGSKDKHIHDVLLRNKIDIIHTNYEWKYNDKEFILSHYPLNEWGNKVIGSVNLHGFSSIDSIQEKNSIDIGVDNHHFEPVSIENVIKIVSNF